MPGHPNGADRRVRPATPLLAVAATLVAVAAFSATRRSGEARAPAPPDPPPSSPDRVVSLLPSASELLAAMGAGGRVVGRSRFDRTPAVSGARIVGDVVSPSVETVLALEPDLVVTWRGVTAPGPVHRLEEAGVPVYEAWMETVEDVLGTARELGLRLGIPARGDSLAREISSGLEAVEAAGSSTGLGVVVVLHPEPLLAAGPGSYLDRLIRIAGGRNVFGDADSPWPRVSLEAVVRRDPDAVVVSGTAGTLPGWLERDERWAGLAAVRTGGVLVLPPHLLERPGPGIVKTARRLSAFLGRIAARERNGAGR